MPILCDDTITLGSLCTCSQLVYEADCQIQKDYCSWSNNQCTQIPCSQLGQNTCKKSLSCYYNNGVCNNFQDCTSLTGNSVANCQNQNMQCTYISNQNCSAFSTHYQSCTIYGQAVCAQKKANNGRCYWSGAMCAELTGCDLLGSGCGSNPNLYANVCVPSGNTCVSAQCSNLTQQNCNFLPIAPNKLNVGTLCTYTNGACISSNPSDLSADNCYQLTYGTYRWSVNYSEGKNKCTKCQENILVIFLIMILFIMQ